MLVLGFTLVAAVPAWCDQAPRASASEDDPDETAVEEVPPGIPASQIATRAEEVRRPPCKLHVSIAIGGALERQLAKEPEDPREF